jgi:hypothetical protein
MSVMVTVVLLKVDLMNAIPDVTLRRTFRRLLAALFALLLDDPLAFATVLAS